jgi:hypothetical protein
MPAPVHEQDQHRCPRPGCSALVPDNFFACRVDWFTLSPQTRRRITATSRQSILSVDRRAAIEAAMTEYRAMGPRQ